MASSSRFAVLCVGITDMEMLCNSAQNLIQTNIPYCTQKRYCSRTCQQAQSQTRCQLRAAWHWYSHTLLVFVQNHLTQEEYTAGSKQKNEGAQKETGIRKAGFL